MSKKKIRGRPSKYTKELSNKICALISQGKSLRTICLDEKLPCIATLFNWMSSTPDFLEQYARAKIEQADAFVEDILDIADDGTNDYIETIDKNGDPVIILNNEHIQRSKLRIDTRKWLASKLKPKKYGDKVTHAGDGDNPIALTLHKVLNSLPAPEDEEVTYTEIESDQE